MMETPVENTGYYPLTDEQIMAVFQYTQGGVKALEKFRDE